MRGGYGGGNAYACVLGTADSAPRYRWHRGRGKSLPWAAGIGGRLCAVEAGRCWPRGRLGDVNERAWRRWLLVSLQSAVGGGMGSRRFSRLAVVGRSAARAEGGVGGFANGIRYASNLGWAGAPLARVSVLGCNKGLLILHSFFSLAPLATIVSAWRFAPSFARAERLCCVFVFMYAPYAC